LPWRLSFVWWQIKWWVFVRELAVRHPWLATGILKWLLGFWKVCAPLAYTYYGIKTFSGTGFVRNTPSH